MRVKTKWGRRYYWTIP